MAQEFTWKNYRCVVKIEDGYVITSFHQQGDPTPTQLTAEDEEEFEKSEFALGLSLMAEGLDKLTPDVPKEDDHKELDIFCERCGERLNSSKAVWLELNTNTGLYSKDGFVPSGESQGCFSFGAACARTVLKNGGSNERIGRMAKR